MDFDKKIKKMRLDILSLETELVLMDRYNKSFPFKKTRYNNMLENIRWALNDLSSFERRVEEINKRDNTK